MYKPNLYKKYTEIKNEDQKLAQVKKDELYYPKYHLAPQFGLLNDPNGLAYFNNEYHIFYQYHPNDTEHGMKNWYHLTTKDFINYMPHGIKLAPEQIYENYGIFSGSAYPHGKELYIYYTANHRDPENNYQRTPYQCLAKMNKNNQIISKQVILEKPAQYSEHYRDPIVLKDGSMLIGAQDNKLTGCLSLVNNSFERKIEFSNELKGTYMLECPNYLEYEEQNVLMVSTQGLNNEKYLNRHSVVYMLTDLEPMIAAEAKILDYGFDFYAPQVFDDGNRKVLIPWIGQADTIYPYDKELGWSQVLGIPREVNLKNGILYQTPIAEYRKLETKEQDMPKSFKTSRTYKLTVELTATAEVIIGKDSVLKISYDDGILMLDRSRCDVLFSEEFGQVRNLTLNENQVKLDIYVDNSVLEIFVNDGMYTLSTRFFIKNLEWVSVNNIETIKYTEMEQINYLSERKLEMN